MSTVIPEAKVIPQAERKWIGKSVKRKEDLRLLQGKGKFTDDVQLPGMLYAAFLRSPYAHAKIRGIDVSKAAKHPGVSVVLTGRDDARLLHSWMVHPGLHYVPRYSLAVNKVRYVGEPVAAVAAVDKGTAEDAVELIEVEYEPLPVVVDAEESMKPGAPILYEERPDNIYFHQTYSKGDLDKAFREADVVVREKISSHRYVPTPIENRSWLVNYCPIDGTMTVWASSQYPHVLRTYLSEILGIPENKIRVISIDVGGGFGPKSHTYPDEVTVCLLSMKTGKPVKWVEERREHLTASAHEREVTQYAEIAVKNDGTISAVKTKNIVDVGVSGIFWTEAQPCQLSVVSIPGPYRFQNFAYETYGVMTNKAMNGAHRGFYRPVACLVMERLIDLAAKKIGMDPFEMRMKNIIQPDEMPFQCASGVAYDSGNYPEAFRRAIRLCDYPNLRKWQEEMRRQGRYVGIGIGGYVEYTAPNSTRAERYLGWKVGTWGAATVKVDPSGKVTVLTGTQHQGQAHETVYAQVVAEYLGVHFDDVIVNEGDTDSAPYGMGAWASRSSVTEGGACVKAALKVKEKALAIAAHILGTKPDDLVISDGKVTSKSDPSKSMNFKDLAYVAYRNPTKLPPGVDAGLEASVTYEPESGTTCSFGLHIAVVEVDVETGKITIPRYYMFEDCGVAMNPMTVHGQSEGALLHAIGGTIYEHLVYDKTGQLLASTFMDYLIPTSIDGPPGEIKIGMMETPSRGLGGFKGMGEGACIGAPAALCNAVEDALSPLGVKITETPLSPERIHNLVKAAKAAKK